MESPILNYSIYLFFSLNLPRKVATNKIRCPVFCLTWTPEGRRLITGASSGEFTLWNGLTFNFETILQV
jgi:hypothetical protein